jgi:putrescine aminotransferase
MDTKKVKTNAFNHLWSHNSDWTQVAEEGGPTVIVEGDGVRVKDSEGNEWVDVNGGYSSVNIGYGRKEVAEAMYEQMQELPYFPQGSTSIPAIKLAKKLSDITPGDLNRTWFSSGGSEANETAIKIARAYHKRKGDAGRYKIISRRGSYHGGTGGVLWAGSGDRLDYEPASYPGMIYAPHPDPYRCELGGFTASECAILCSNAIEDLIKFHGASSVAAVIAEPIAGASGTAVPGDEYWPNLRKICDKYGVLLIADEIVCGFGRTGEMFAVNHWNIVPDLLCVAKGITSSYSPLGATIVRDKVSEVFKGKDNVFYHTLTFGGHPVSAAAALANIDILEKEDLVANSREMGSYLLRNLNQMKEQRQMIGNVRGKGLLASIELVSDRKTKTHFSPELKLGPRLSQKFKSRKMILNPPIPYINLQPQLCSKKPDIDFIVSNINEVLQEIENEVLR